LRSTWKSAHDGSRRNNEAAGLGGVHFMIAPLVIATIMA
jgi:hypothetical protein